MAQINKPSEHFNTKLYTGTGATQSINMGLQPDLCWIKNRNLSGASAQYHHLYDSVRGGNLRLVTSSTSAENATNDRFNGITSTGFDLVGSDSGTNANNSTYVAWGWEANGSGSANTDGTISSTVSANTTAGFSIVSYTGTGANATVGHGLGVTPQLVIYRRRNNTTSWRVMTTLVDGSHDKLYLNSTDAKADVTETAPTNSVLNIGTQNEVNNASDPYIAYCFASKKGFSKLGKYKGNFNTDGTFIYTGFKPAWVMTKRTDSTSDWRMFDGTRAPFNPANKWFNANATAGEGTDVQADLLSNGFKLRDAANAFNASGGTFIYMAFAEQPLVGTNNIPCTAR